MVNKDYKINKTLLKSLVNLAKLHKTDDLAQNIFIKNDCVFWSDKTKIAKLSRKIDLIDQLIDITQNKEYFNNFENSINFEVYDLYQNTFKISYHNVIDEDENMLLVTDENDKSKRFQNYDINSLPDKFFNLTDNFVNNSNTKFYIDPLRVYKKISEVIKQIKQLNKENKLKINLISENLPIYNTNTMNFAYIEVIYNYDNNYVDIWLRFQNRELNKQFTTLIEESEFKVIGNINPEKNKVTNFTYEYHSINAILECCKNLKLNKFIACYLNCNSNDAITLIDESVESCFSLCPIRVNQY